MLIVILGLLGMAGWRAWVGQYDEATFFVAMLLLIFVVSIHWHITQIHKVTSHMVVTAKKGPQV